MKSCTRCYIEKPLDSFSPNKSCVGGRSTQCKACMAEYHRLRRIQNPEYVRNLERNRASAKSQTRKDANKRRYAEKREVRLAQERERYAEKSEHIKATARAYRAANRSKVYGWNGTRRAALRNALPAWANRQEIASIYSEAARIQAETGIEQHVDHFYPLSGKTVSGLHVPANLQIIPAKQNLSKGARCPTM